MSKTKVTVMILHHEKGGDEWAATGPTITRERETSYNTDLEDLLEIVEDARANHPWATHFEIHWGNNPVASGPL